MKQIFSKGDKKVYTKQVEQMDIAKFESGTVHAVCSTFSLAQAVEWCTRLFVLDMKDEDEEGIGTMLHIDHHAPALIDDELYIEAKLQKVEGNEVLCAFEVMVNSRLIASGRTGQKILKKAKIDQIFKTLK